MLRIFSPTTIFCAGRRSHHRAIYWYEKSSGRCLVAYPDIETVLWIRVLNVGKCNLYSLNVKNILNRTWKAPMLFLLKKNCILVSWKRVGQHWIPFVDCCKAQFISLDCVCCTYRFNTSSLYLIFSLRSSLNGELVSISLFWLFFWKYAILILSRHHF